MRQGMLQKMRSGQPVLSRTMASTAPGPGMHVGRPRHDVRPRAISGQNDQPIPVVRSILRWADRRSSPLDVHTGGGRCEGGMGRGWPFSTAESRTKRSRMTRVSVVMAVYNAESTLRPAVQSILDQDLADLELIVVDDGSTDCSADLIRDYARTDPRITLLQNQKNIGLSASLNKGIEQARSAYVARQDADDVSDPTRLHRQWDYMQGEALDLCGTGVRYIDTSGRMLREEEGPDVARFRQSLFSQRAIFPHGSAMFRADVFRQLGGYDNRFFYSQDMELWLRFLDAGKSVGRLDEPLYQFRIQPGFSSKAKRVGQRLYTQYLNRRYSGLNANDEELERINHVIQDLRDQTRPVLTQLLEKPYYLLRCWVSRAKGRHSSV